MSLVPVDMMICLHLERSYWLTISPNSAALLTWTFLVLFQKNLSFMCLLFESISRTTSSSTTILSGLVGGRPGGGGGGVGGESVTELLKRVWS